MWFDLAIWKLWKLRLFLFLHYFIPNLKIMIGDGRNATIHSCLMGDYPSVYFHTGDEPGYLKGLTVDENWRIADFDVFQLSFSPSRIRSFSERPIIIPFTDIASTVLDTVFYSGLCPYLVVQSNDRTSLNAFSFCYRRFAALSVCRRVCLCLSPRLFALLYR